LPPVDDCFRPSRGPGRPPDHKHRLSPATTKAAWRTRPECWAPTMLTRWCIAGGLRPPRSAQHNHPTETAWLTSLLDHGRKVSATL
jgi:hypothetical protein